VFSSLRIDLKRIRPKCILGSWEKGSSGNKAKNEGEWLKERKTR